MNAISINGGKKVCLFSLFPEEKKRGTVKLKGSEEEEELNVGVTMGTYGVN